VAGHSLRTGKPCCHPSRTHAPDTVLEQPTPQPSAAIAGPANAKEIKQEAKQTERRVMALLAIFEPVKQTKIAPPTSFPRRNGLWSGIHRPREQKSGRPSRRLEHVASENRLSRTSWQSRMTRGGHRSSKAA
jgi:hypothetical protein